MEMINKREDVKRGKTKLLIHKPLIVRIITILISFMVSSVCVSGEENRGGGPTPAPAPAPAPAGCREMRRELVSACRPVILREPPSGWCCERIKVTPIECICSVITPKIAPLISDINYAIRVVQSCGRHVPRRFKCGSITTP